ncbi:MAG: ABC transporter substrate-binding protein [Planctomycetota bacterium]
MTATSGNALAAGLVLLASCLLAWYGARLLELGQPDRTSSAGVIDASGTFVPRGDYRRIACSSTIAAELLPELLPVDRLILVPTWFRDSNPRAFRVELAPGPDGTAPIGTIDTLSSIEQLLAADPDLVVVNTFVAGGSARVQRLRALGITVLDLGVIHGIGTLRAQIRMLGTVCGVPERAAAIERGLLRRLATVAAHVDAEERLRAVYVAHHSGSLSGGTTGSSYHDLLRVAGLIDAAAERFQTPWPPYDPEHILGMDPDLIVTEHGRTGAILATPGLDRLRAVQAGRIVELPPGTDTTALGLLPAAEFLCDAVYGPPPGLQALTDEAAPPAAP